MWKYGWMHGWIDGWTDRQQVVRQLNGLVGKQRDGKQGGREESGEEIDIRMKDMLAKLCCCLIIENIGKMNKFWTLKYV